MSIYRKILIAAILCISTSWVAGQVTPTQTDPNDGAKPGTAPISGIEILIGLGGLLGAKKVFDLKRKAKG